MTDFLSCPPDYSFQLIDRESIDFPDDFLSFLHDGQVDPITLKNLKEFGQWHPLLVQQQQSGNQYHLVAGFSYFSAIKTLGINKVFCQVLPPSLPPLLIYSIQILHDLSSPQSSPILQAHLLRRARHELSEEELLSLLSLMGFKPQRYKLKELSDLLRLDSSAILALHRGILSPKSAKMLSILLAEDQRSLTNLLSAYMPGGSKQQKLIEMVTELALRNNRPVAEIVNSWLPEQGMSTENRPQLLHGLLQSLHEQCYPDKIAAEKNFKALLQELQPSEEITVEHSLSFEDESLEIRLKIGDTATLREKWERIKTILQ